MCPPPPPGGFVAHVRVRSGFRSRSCRLMSSWTCVTRNSKSACQLIQHTQAGMLIWGPGGPVVSPSRSGPSAAPSAAPVHRCVRSQVSHHRTVYGRPNEDLIECNSCCCVQLPRTLASTLPSCRYAGLTRAHATAHKHRRTLPFLALPLPFYQRLMPFFALSLPVLATHIRSAIALRSSRVCAYLKSCPHSDTQCASSTATSPIPHFASPGTQSQDTSSYKTNRVVC